MTPRRVVVDFSEAPYGTFVSKAVLPTEALAEAELHVRAVDRGERL
jgi:hypothetical protein